MNETMHFVDIMVGWKGFVSFLYYETGFLCGIPVGNWKNTATLDGKDVTPLLGPDGDVDAEYRHVEYGVYIGLGAVFRITENIAVETGLQLQMSFTEAYENEDNPEQNTIRTRALLFKAGATYCL